MQLLIAAIHSRKADLADAKSESAAAASEQSLAKQAFDRFLEKRPTWTIADEERRMPFGPGAEAHAMRDHWFDTLAKLGLPP